MNKNRFYIAVISGLVLSNILLVMFVVFRSPAKSRFHPGKPRNMVIRKLDFDRQQVAEYDELIREHRTHIQGADRRLMTLKNELYGYLSADNVDTAKTDSLVKEMGRIQEQVERIHFHHFMDIKKLCRPDQLARFDELADEISDIFFSHPPPHR